MLLRRTHAHTHLALAAAVAALALTSVPSPTHAQEQGAPPAGAKPPPSLAKASPPAKRALTREERIDLEAEELAEAAVRAEDEAELAAEKEEYAKRLEELHRTRAERKRESAETAAVRYRRILKQPGFVDEMRVHGDRLARLERIGNLLIVGGADYATRMRVFSLIAQEADRHDQAIGDLEEAAKRKEPPAK